MAGAWRGTTVAAGALAALLTACTPSAEETGADRSLVSPPASSPAATATGASTGQAAPTQPTSPTGTTGTEDVGPAFERPPEPPRSGCYRLRFGEVTAPTNDSRAVPCGRRHTAQTFHVGRIDAVVDGHLVAVDSRLVEEQLATTCPRLLDRYLGGTAEDRDLSRFAAAWFGPTLEQSDLGATWFRCDVVALAGDDRLAPLPPPRRLRGVLDREGALDSWGLCGTAAPGSRGFDRVICSRRHAWQAIATIPLARGRYPGTAAVRRAGDGSCRDMVRSVFGSPERFQYGWEWPTREQWSAGQRFGYCWAPD